MDVSLRHITGILQDRPLKAFQIAAIYREVSIDQAGAYYTYGRQVVIGLLYMHEKLGLAHGALDHSTILLNLNGRMKIGKVLERNRTWAATNILSEYRRSFY